MADNQQENGDSFQAGDPEPLNKDQVTRNHCSSSTMTDACIYFCRLTTLLSSLRRSTPLRIIPFMTHFPTSNA